MIDRIHVIGSGRVGSAVAARLSERGIAVRVGRTVEDDPQLVLLCVPDAAIADVARGLTPGAARRARQRRDAARARSNRTCAGSASIRCRRSRARAGRSSSTARGPRSRPRRTRRARAGTWLAETLGLRPFELADSARAALPRGRRIRVELPRHAAPRGLAALRERGRPARGARAAHAAHDRERLRADGADRPRRLGDGRGAPRRDRASARRSSTSSTRPSPAATLALAT